MTLGEILKKIFYAIINFIKAIILTIIGIFFKPQKKEEEKSPIKSEKGINNNPKTPMRQNSTTAPNEPNTKTNPHSDTTTDSSNDIVLELPKTKFESLKNISNSEKHIIYTKEYLCLLIEEELEHIYKEQNFKVEKAEKEIKEKIKKFEEKIIPIIEKEINFYHLSKEEDIKKTVTKTVTTEIKEFPILPPVHVEITKDPSTPLVEPSKVYTPPMRSNSPIIPPLPRKKDEPTPLKENHPPTASITSTIIPTTELDLPEKKHIETTSPVTREDIPKQSIKDTIKNAATVATLMGIKAATEVLSPTEQKIDEPKQEEVKASLDLPSLETPTPIIEKDKELERIQEAIEQEEIKTSDEAAKLKQELEEKIAELDNIAEQKKREERESGKKQEQAYIEQLKLEQQEAEKREELAKSLVRDTEISAIAIESTEAIEDSKAELEKEDFFDKDYERIEMQINKMLDDIENTRLRYGDKLSSRQKNKLEREESKLREAKEHIAYQKNQDVEDEQRALNEYITETEMIGLQNELKKIDEKNKQEVNEEFLRRMEYLQGMTQEQVAQADKRILFKKLNKASFLLEMGSILAFPFIRNRYFFAFTLGLIINNHFNFINAFWRRKTHQPDQIDLSRIKQGQDALNGALDVTYQNIVELDMIEQDALARYPELAYDPRFINQITDLRIKLNNNYNKLMKKNKIMETYYGKAKHHVKVLKKEQEI